MKNGSLMSATGPTLGQETLWTKTGKIYGANFLSTSGKYAASIARDDQDTTVALGEALDAKF